MATAILLLPGIKQADTTFEVMGEILLNGEDEDKGDGDGYEPSCLLLSRVRACVCHPDGYMKEEEEEEVVVVVYDEVKEEDG